MLARLFVLHILVRVVFPALCEVPVVLTPGGLAAISKMMVQKSYLLTNMKSPIRSVGIIEPEGIRNGSTTKALSTKTKAKTGKS